MTVRSKHNNLLNYFLYDNKYLSKAYVRKCKNFIDNIRAEIHIEHLKELKKQMEKNNECRRKRTLDRKQSNRVV